jgi:hypothetical protein
MYVCFLLNNTWCEVVDDIPVRMSTGSTNDISPLLCFHFWEPVYYKFDNSDFPSDSREKCRHFVGIDKICMVMTRLACNRAIESSYWRMDNDSDVGLLTGYVLYRLPVELEFMDLDTFPR